MLLFGLVHTLGHALEPRLCHEDRNGLFAGSELDVLQRGVVERVDHGHVKAITFQAKRHYPALPAEFRREQCRDGVTDVAALLEKLEPQSRCDRPGHL